MVKRLVALLLLFVAFKPLLGIEKEPLSEYKFRRDRLAVRIKGNALVLRGAPDKELTKYQQEQNFYYLTGVDQPLFESLKKRRFALAREQGVPAYVVFADRTLLEMAQIKPGTIAAMGRIHGVGEAKLARYGDVFLEVIRKHADTGPARPAGAG